MAETDLTLSALTGLLAISTIAVAIATFLVWRATSKVADVTKETTKLTIMPRISVIGHGKAGSDNDHDHYQFILRNEGVGNAFDVKIEISHNGGKTVFPILKTFPVNAGHHINDNSIDKDAKEAEFKISYKDHADNKYERKFTYSLENDSTGYSVQV